jgi:hypothetical protein
MNSIILGGKEYELKFTYMAILTLEKVYDRGIGKIFKELDLENVGVLNTLVYACLKRHKAFATATVDDVALALDNAFEDGELTFEQLAKAIQDAVMNSVIVKQAGQGNEKK